uniref:Uncharacterized protein n=1 Tax=Strigamia maritima TaxID=126957 RepID=T1IS20_STRMM
MEGSIAYKLDILVLWYLDCFYFLICLLSYSTKMEDDNRPGHVTVLTDETFTIWRKEIEVLFMD